MSSVVCANYDQLSRTMCPSAKILFNYVLHFHRGSFNHVFFPYLSANASAPSLAETATSSLSMTCDSCYQLTLMLRLDSDWIRPIAVTLTNATVSSSEVIGSACHVAKIINEQTVQLYAPIKHEPRGGVGNVITDLGSSSHDTGSGGLGPESTVVDLNAGSGVLDPGSAVVDPGCNVTDTGSYVGDTGTNHHDPIHSPCDPDICESGNICCDAKRNVGDLGSGVHGSEKGSMDRESCESDPGNSAKEQGCDLGRYKCTYMCRTLTK